MSKVPVPMGDMWGDNGVSGNRSDGCEASGGKRILYSLLRVVQGVQVKLQLEEEVRNGRPTFHLNQEIIGSYSTSDGEEHDDGCGLQSSDDGFPCVNCQKKFTTMSLLHRHARVHGNAFICNIGGCRAGFQHAGTLTKHKVSHSNVKTLGQQLQRTTFGQGQDQHGTRDPVMPMMPLMEDQVKSPLFSLPPLALFNYYPGQQQELEMDSCGETFINLTMM